MDSHSEISRTSVDNRPDCSLILFSKKTLLQGYQWLNRNIRSSACSSNSGQNLHPMPISSGRAGWLLMAGGLQNLDKLYDPSNYMSQHNGYKAIKM